MTGPVDASHVAAVELHTGPTSRHVGRSIAKIATTAIVIVAAAGAGWLAAGRLQSPDQTAAAMAAPSPLPVTAEVSRGTLAEVITAQATVQRASTTSVSIPLPATSPVVTAVNVSQGQSLAPGTMILAINDRPLFAVPGSFAFYRVMGEGDTGADIKQLQTGLRAAGYTIPDKEFGRFGWNTKAALRKLYAANGFELLSEEVPAATDATGDGPPPAPTRRVIVSPSELIVIASSFPATIDAFPALGTPLSPTDASITIVEGGYIARAEAPAGVLLKTPVGTKGTLQGPDGEPIEVEVAAIEEGDESTGASGALIITPVGDALIPGTWQGESVLASLTLQTIAGDALIVPTRAVAVLADGSATVMRVDTSGGSTLVKVKEIGRLNGLSAVSPLQPSELGEGDDVRVE